MTNHPLSAGWREHPRYPDPLVQTLDPRFETYRIFSAAVERLFTGCRWAEGPVWMGDARHLIWSDIPNDRMLKWDETTGAVSAYRAPSNFGNGNTRDRQGRLITCEHGGRRVTRTNHDGSIDVLADSFEGKPFNSPNDVVVKSDGSIWFTDPPFGILGHYEGQKAEPELPQAVYRLDPEARGVRPIVAGPTATPHPAPSATTAGLTMVNDEVLAPNGLAFSPDETVLYVVESRGVPNRKILAFDVAADGRSIANKRVLIDAGPGGTPDGMRCDVDGNLWCGWGMGSAELDGVMVFAPDGAPIGRIALPERCANVCFGGRKRNRLFMAASQSLYALYTNAQGAPGG